MQIVYKEKSKRWARKQTERIQLKSNRFITPRKTLNLHLWGTGYIRKGAPDFLETGIYESTGKASTSFTILCVHPQLRYCLLIIYFWGYKNKSHSLSY